MKAPSVNLSVGPMPELRWVPIDQIRVDHNYQRDLRPARVKQILAGFEWAKFGALSLAEQDDGTFNCIDGQHRFEAARQHPKITEVPAAIVRFEGGREEADAFLGVNVHRTGVTAIEKYHAGIEAGDPLAMAVCSVLDEAGCEVVQAAGLSAPNKTHAVGALQRCIRTYGEKPTTAALLYLRLAWPDDKDALKGTIITALARITKNNVVNEKRMVSVLQETNARTLAADAETIRKLRGGDAPTSIARTLCDLYNRGLRGNTIEIGVKP